MGTKERLDLLKEYLDKEAIDYESYCLEDEHKEEGKNLLETKETVINELLKRISNLEFEVEERDRRIDKAIEYIEENLQPYENNLPIIAIDYLNVIFLLKGKDKK